MSTHMKQLKHVRGADALSIFLTTKCHCKSMDIPTTELTLWFSSVPMPLILPVVLPAWVALPKSSTMFSKRGGGMIARVLSSEGWSSNFFPGSNRLES